MTIAHINPMIDTIVFDATLFFFRNKIMLLRPPEAEESLDRRGPRAGVVCLPVSAVDTLSPWAPGVHEPTGRVCE